MAPLSSLSAVRFPPFPILEDTFNNKEKEALSRLRAYVPPPSTLYDSLPVSRRAAVLIFLFPDQVGELRVVLTVRANTLNSFPGQVALPGGKASSLHEPPQTTALRESHEEIGLPLDPPPNLLCRLPCHLSKTHLCVLPFITFLPTPPTWTPNPLEVSTVFDWPLRAFLQETPLADGDSDEPSGSGSGRNKKKKKWYEGFWATWHGQEWRMHSFHVPSSAAAATAQHHKVWGMTARILVDAARVAYAREPEFEYGSGYGDEELIWKLVGRGQMGELGGGAGAGVEAEAEVVVEEEEEDSQKRTTIPAKI